MHTTTNNKDPEQQSLEEKVIQALKMCYDPEIPVDVYEMGLIYSIDVLPENIVRITMTLTSPACPVAGALLGEVETRVKAIPEVKDAHVNLVWDPPWHIDRMSEAAKLELGF